MLEREYRRFVVLLDSERYSMRQSCGNDVEDELELELEDNPGATTGTTIFYLAHNSFPIFGQTWLFDHWSTHRKIKTAVSSSNCTDSHEEVKIVNENLPHVFAILRWM